MFAFKPFHVILHALFDLFSFAFAKLANKPFVWVAVILRVVASGPSYGRIFFRMTQGDHVFWNATRTILRNQWYPVVHCNNVPKIRKPTTYSALTLKILVSYLFVYLGECIRKIFLPCATAMCFSTAVFRMQLFPLSRKRASFLDVSSLAFVFLNFVRMIFAPFAMIFYSAWRPIVDVLPRFDLFIVSITVNLGRYLAAFFTVTTPTTWYARTFGELCQGFGFTASGATLCIHSILVNANSQWLCGQRVTSDTFSVANLDHYWNYTAQWQVAQ